MITERLSLVAATLELCNAEAPGRDTLATALGARVPDEWPPEVFEADDVERVRKQLLAKPALAEWTLYYIVQRPTVDTTEATLIGIAGFVGPPTSDGAVEIGYAILPDYQGRGYASEAVNALVSHAFADPVVQCITATTYETLQPSIRVLQKTGFASVDGPNTTGLIRFERLRAGALRS
jgi:ribosomal-protein-alanine N-acetyltransferase